MVKTRIASVSVKEEHFNFVREKGLSFSAILRNAIEDNDDYKLSQQHKQAEV